MLGVKTCKLNSSGRLVALCYYSSTVGYTKFFYRVANPNIDMPE